MIYAMKLALEWIEDAAAVLSRTSSAIQGGLGAEAEGLGGCSVKVATALREALAEQPAQQELVCIGYWNQKTGAYYKPDQISAAHKKLIEDGILRLCYTSPPAQRKPLTHEQRVDLLAKFEAHKHEWHAPAILIDMVEAAHGIGEKK